MPCLCMDINKCLVALVRINHPTSWWYQVMEGWKEQILWLSIARSSLDGCHEHQAQVEPPTSVSRGFGQAAYLWPSYLMLCGVTSVQLNWFQSCPDLGGLCDV